MGLGTIKMAHETQLKGGRMAVTDPAHEEDSKAAGVPWA